MRRSVEYAKKNAAWAEFFAREGLVLARAVCLVILLVGAVCAPARAQDGLPQRKVALIIGNASYAFGRADGGAATLDTPLADAVAIEAKLKQMGFVTTLLTNAKNNAMREQIGTFMASLRADDLVVVYYAGHGLELGGQTYLIPVDAQINTESSVKLVGLPLDYLVPDKSLRIFGLWIVLDTCRENPFGARAKGTSQPSGGLPGEAPDNTLIFFATSPGETASDGQGVKPEHGVFTTALLEALDSDTPTLAGVMGKTVRKVRDLTNNTQTPRRTGQFIDENFDLRQVAGVAPPPPRPPSPSPLVIAAVQDPPPAIATPSPAPTPPPANPQPANPQLVALPPEPAAPVAAPQPYRPEPQEEPQRPPKPLGPGDGAAPMLAASRRDQPQPDLSRPRMPALVMPVKPTAFCTYLDYLDYLNTYYKEMTAQADANYRTARVHQDYMHHLFAEHRDQMPVSIYLKAVDDEMKVYDRITDQYFQFSMAVVHLSTPLSEVPQRADSGCAKPPWPALASGQSTSVTPVN